MKLEGKGTMLRIYIGETDQYNGVPLYHAIVMKARRLGLAGATVYRGIEGFGANSRIHTTSILRLSEDLPVVIDVIDTADRIDQLLQALDDMISEGLAITIQDVTIEMYRHRTRKG